MRNMEKKVEVETDNEGFCREDEEKRRKMMLEMKMKMNMGKDDGG